MGAFGPGDTRVFTFLQYDAAGNVSVPSDALRAVPSVVGLGTQAAAARLAAAGFRLGNVRETIATGVAPGTVVGPTELRLATTGSSVDVVASLDRAPDTVPAPDRERQDRQGPRRHRLGDSGPRLRDASRQRRRHAGHDERPAPLHLALQCQGGRHDQEAAPAVAGAPARVSIA